MTDEGEWDALEREEMADIDHDDKVRAVALAHAKEMSALRSECQDMVETLTAESVAALQAAFTDRDKAELEGFGNGWLEAMAHLESTRTVHMGLCVFRCNRCDWTDFPAPDGEPRPHNCAEHLQGDQSEIFQPQAPTTPDDPTPDGDPDEQR